MEEKNQTLKLCSQILVILGQNENYLQKADKILRKNDEFPMSHRPVFTNALDIFGNLLISLYYCIIYL